jgi:hypothetical protein
MTYEVYVDKVRDRASINRIVQGIFLDFLAFQKVEISMNHEFHRQLAKGKCNKKATYHGDCSRRKIWNHTKN